MPSAFNSELQNLSLGSPDCFYQLVIITLFELSEIEAPPGTSVREPVPL